jgi:SPX domain protein involved in polyphosphate accumulation
MLLSNRINKLEKKRDKVRKVIIIQRCVRRWLRRLNKAREKYNIPNDETLNIIVDSVRILEDCDTITAIRIVSTDFNF